HFLNNAVPVPVRAAWKLTPHTNPKNLANSPRRKVDPTASLAAAHLPPSLTNPLTNRIECGPNPGQMLCPAGNSQSGASAITFRRFVVLRLEAIGMMIYRLGGQGGVPYYGSEAPDQAPRGPDRGAARSRQKPDRGG